MHLSEKHQFTSWRAYVDFANAVRTKHRFVRPPEIDQFLDAVKRTALPRISEMPSGWRFWRAQLGHCERDVTQEGKTFQQPSAYLPDRMKPLPGQSKEGRVNPKGIPCLYGATTRETAMAEVRPRLGEYVSLGLFKVTKELRIVNCSKFHAEHPLAILISKPWGMDKFWTDASLSPEEIDETVWRHIDNAFSQPVTESDTLPDYIPTQVLAEVFKAEGYDGLAYKSKFTDDGFNVAFFDPSVAMQLHGSLHSVEKVSYKFYDPPDDEYFIKEDQVIRMVITDIRPVPKEEAQE